jgi:DNA-binding PadR family transcriptional regulator
MSRNSQPLTVEYLLVGILSQKPMHGYDLFKYLNTDPVLSQIWAVKQSMLYAMLDKLEQLKLLESSILPSSTLPVKREFRATRSGQMAFQEWVTVPVDRPRDFRQEFLAKISYLLRTDLDQARTLLETQRDICMQWLEYHQQHSAESEDEYALKVILDYKQSQMEAILNWIQFCLQSVPL